MPIHVPTFNHKIIVIKVGFDFRFIGNSSTRLFGRICWLVTSMFALERDRERWAAGRRSTASRGTTTESNYTPIKRYLRKKKSQRPKFDLAVTKSLRRTSPNRSGNSSNRSSRDSVCAFV